MAGVTFPKTYLWNSSDGIRTVRDTAVVVLLSDGTQLHMNSDGDIRRVGARSSGRYQLWFLGDPKYWMGLR